VIIAGSELGNGYSEINDPVDQLMRFKEQEDARNAGDDESQMLDIDFVEMLEYGMPPTSGWGHSERLFWFLEDISAREGTLFPLMREEVENTTKKIYNLNDNAGAIKGKQDFSKKIIMVLDKELVGWQLTNTVGHLSAYLGNKISKEKFTSQDSFKLSDGLDIHSNSQYMIVTLSAEKKELRKLHKKLLEEKKLEYLVYVKEMIDFNEDSKLADALSKQNSEELNICGIGIFGDKDTLTKLTKNYSLFK
jgi:lysyl-tRNA synthetase class 2